MAGWWRNKEHNSGNKNWLWILYKRDSWWRLPRGQAESCQDEQGFVSVGDLLEMHLVLFAQSDACLEALKIDWDKIRQHAVSRGVLMARVPIRDFDHNDQALMLSEAVRTLAVLLAFGGKVYVHCTAGINRASLTVLAYLTFVQVFWMSCFVCSLFDMLGM